MNALFERVRNLFSAGKSEKTLKDKKGQTLVEYALILVLIAIVALLVLSGLGKNVNNTFSKVNSTMTSAGS